MRPVEMMPRDPRDLARIATASLGGGDHRDARNLGAHRPLPSQTARVSWGGWRNGSGAAVQRGSGAIGVVEGACTNSDYERRPGFNSGSMCPSAGVAQPADGANRPGRTPPHKVAYDNHKRRPELPSGGCVALCGPVRSSIGTASADVHLKIVARAAPVAASPRASAIAKKHVFIPARQPPWTGRIVVERRRLRLRWLGDVGEVQGLPKARGDALAFFFTDLVTRLPCAVL